jgi:hypothetical protein
MGKIHKINSLIHEQSFLQINYENNFKTFDFKGSLIDVFSRNNNLLGINESDGIVLRFNNKEIKIASNSFWVHTNKPDGLDRFSNDYNSEIKKLNEIVNVKKIVRIGWRNYFVYEFIDKKTRDDCFDSFFPKEDLIQPKSMEFFVKQDNIINNFFIKKVTKVEEDVPGILFDIDSFKTFKDGLDIGNTKTEIKKLRENIQSETILNKINLFIK